MFSDTKFNKYQDFSEGSIGVVLPFATTYFAYKTKYCKRVDTLLDMWFQLSSKRNFQRSNTRVRINILLIIFFFLLPTITNLYQLKTDFFFAFFPKDLIGLLFKPRDLDKKKCQQSYFIKFYRDGREFAMYINSW